jgi:hypothetical protein
MKKKTLAWILGGGAAFAGATLFLAACSDDPKPITTKDSGTDGTVGVDSGKDGTTPTDGGGDADAAPTCFSKLRPNADAGPFCYFIPKPADAGNGINCGVGQTCCYGAPKGGDAGFDPSVCVDGGASACPTPSNPDASPGDSFECTQKSDCTGGQACCIIPFGDAGVTVGTDQFTCNFAKAEKGTRCKATCGSGELQGCQQNSDCPNGQTCTQLDVGTGDRLQMGYCK